MKRTGLIALPKNNKVYFQYRGKKFLYWQHSSTTTRRLYGSTARRLYSLLVLDSSTTSRLGSRNIFLRKHAETWENVYQSIDQDIVRQVLNE